MKKVILLVAISLLLVSLAFANQSFEIGKMVDNPQSKSFRAETSVFLEDFENGLTWDHYDGAEPNSMWHLINNHPLVYNNTGYSWFMGDHDLGANGGYLEDHRAEVLPYDIKGRNDYFIKMKFFEKEQVYGEACSAYFKQPSANPTAFYLFKLIEGMGRRFGFHETKDKRTIFDINSPLCDVQVETYISLIRQVNKALFSLVPEFSQYERDFGKMMNFHARRDKAMISNILNYNSRFEDKTIVVLCGYFHRYALVHGLRDNATRGRFFLKDI